MHGFAPRRRAHPDWKDWWFASMAQRPAIASQRASDSFAMLDIPLKLRACLYGMGYRRGTGRCAEGRVQAHITRCASRAAVDR